MQEKLYSMKKELAELLGRDRLLKSAVKEVNKLDMIKASMVIRNPHHETIDIDRILGGELRRIWHLEIMCLLRISVNW